MKLHLRRFRAVLIVLTCFSGSFSFAQDVFFTTREQGHETIHRFDPETGTLHEVNPFIEEEIRMEYNGPAYLLWDDSSQSLISWFFTYSPQTAHLIVWNIESSEFDRIWNILVDTHHYFFVSAVSLADQLVVVDANSSAWIFSLDGTAGIRQFDGFQIKLGDNSRRFEVDFASRILYWIKYHRDSGEIYRASIEATDFNGVEQSALIDSLLFIDGDFSAARYERSFDYQSRRYFTLDQDTGKIYETPFDRFSDNLVTHIPDGDPSGLRFSRIAYEPQKNTLYWTDDSRFGRVDLDKISPTAEVLWANLSSPRDLVVGSDLFPTNSESDLPNTSPAGKFEVFPNPFNQTTSIKLNGDQAGFVELKVFDLLGRELGQHFQRINLVNPNQVVSLNLHDLPSGPYLLHLSSDSQVQTRILLKQ